jgi:hypothetical protein
MRPGLECVLALFSKNRSGIEFLGSGVLVEKHHILTCNHVVSACIERSHRRSLYISFSGGVGVRSSVAPAQRVEIQSVLGPRADLVLLRLKQRLDCKPAIFIEEIGRLSANDFGEELEYCGYYQTGTKVSKSIASVGGVSSRVRDEKTGVMQHIQTDGGVPEGFSGGLAVVPIRGYWYGVGLTRLGGVKAATSRFIATPILAEFCRSYDVSFEMNEPAELSGVASQIVSVSKKIPDKTDVRQWLKSAIPEDSQLAAFSDLTDSDTTFLRLSCTADSIRLESWPNLLSNDGVSHKVFDFLGDTDSSTYVDFYAGPHRKGTRYRVRASATRRQIFITALDSRDLPVRSLQLSVVRKQGEGK